MNARNKFLIILGIILIAATAYYLVSTPRSSDLVLIGTVDSNQVIVSPQMQGRIAKLLVDEGTQVKQGDLIAILDPSELEAEARAAAAMIDSLRSQVSATPGHQRSNPRFDFEQRGECAGQVAVGPRPVAAGGSHAAAHRERQPPHDRTGETGSRLRPGPGAGGKQSEGAAGDRAVSERSGERGRGRSEYRARQHHQAHAAASTVQSTRGQLANAEAQLKEAEVRLGYTKIYAPVSGTVSVRAAREGEVLTAGQPIVTIVDLSDTWVRAAIPETESDHIGLGDTLRIRLPGGTVTSGKVFFKAPEADFATQRDVSRRKRDIRTIVLKVRLDNPKGAYVPGMTAEVLVSPDQLKASAANAGAAAEKQTVISDFQISD